MSANLYTTNDGSLTLRHPVHGELYHSRDGAHKETWDLYIEASGIKEKLKALESLNCRETLNVLDVGLGLGYTALNTIEVWTNFPTQVNLNIVSYEVDPKLIASFISGQASWQTTFSAPWRHWSMQLTSRSLNHWQAAIPHPVTKARLNWHVYHEDITRADFEALMTEFGFKWDFIWQDPFSPKINPALWTHAWFHKLRQTADSQSILMTYSVARVVKDNLSSAKWQWHLIPTTTFKNRWLRASPI